MDIVWPLKPWPPAHDRCRLRAGYYGQEQEKEMRDKDSRRGLALRKAGTIRYRLRGADAVCWCPEFCAMGPNVQSDLWGKGRASYYVARVVGFIITRTSLHPKYLSTADPRRLCGKVCGFRQFLQTNQVLCPEIPEVNPCRREADGAPCLQRKNSGQSALPASSPCRPTDA